MKRLISNVAARLNSLLNQHQIKQFLSVVLAAVLLFPSTLAVGQAARNSQNPSKAATEWVHQNDDSDRPKTTREWNQEARQTEDAPGERLKRIGKESAEAVKDLGSLYPDVAERSGNELKDATTNQ